MSNFYVDNFSGEISLKKTRKLMSRMNDPQNRIKFIHVAGSDGKTSICNMLSFIYRNNNYKVGLFTSPHINSFDERIRINNKTLSYIELLKSKFKIYIKTREKIKPRQKKLSISYFEMTVAMAFDLFNNNSCDIVVLEVGLGGRLDSTNIIKNPLCSVITNISLEHTKILGNNLCDIAYEKSGIIKKNGITVCYPRQEQEVISVVKKTCKEKNNKLVIPDLSRLKIIKSDISGSEFIYKNKKYTIRMLGEHQIYNAITAIEVIFEVNKCEKKLFIEQDYINLGLNKTKVEARIEILKYSPLVILDGSHSPDEVLMLAKFLRKLNKKIIFVIGMLDDKNIDKCLENIFIELKEKAVNFFAVDVNHPRSMKAEKIKNLIENNYSKSVFIINGIFETIHECYNRAKTNDYILVVFGSFYLAKDAKNIIKDTK
ncbi:MAG: hypothetical protein LBJ93_01155 [Clostridiales bacterium]|jgi:dihydrofolate synthase/folylpolyglutamate synthase|nr:hypothetical protein [Clostridiales bacterium]